MIAVIVVLVLSALGIGVATNPIRFVAHEARYEALALVACIGAGLLISRAARRRLQRGTPVVATLMVGALTFVVATSFLPGYRWLLNNAPGAGADRTMTLLAQTKPYAGC